MTKRKIRKMVKILLFNKTKEELMKIAQTEFPTKNQLEKNIAHALLTDYKDGTMQDTSYVLSMIGIK